MVLASYVLPNTLCFEDHAAKTQDTLVDAVENAEVSESNMEANCGYLHRYTYTGVCVYTYIHIYREREKMCVYIYICE